MLPGNYFSLQTLFAFAELRFKLLFFVIILSSALFCCFECFANFRLGFNNLLNKMV